MLFSVGHSAETLPISGKNPMKWTAARPESYGRADVVKPCTPIVTPSSEEKTSTKPCVAAWPTLAIAGAEGAPNPLPPHGHGVPDGDGPADVAVREVQAG